MHWASLGGDSVWGVRFREIEHFVRRFLKAPNGNPEEELPYAELSLSEQQAAQHREAARRLVPERR
jgi:hypothetical protein